jgi:hypothetical protein
MIQYLSLRCGGHFKSVPGNENSDTTLQKKTTKHRLTNNGDTSKHTSSGSTSKHTGMWLMMMMMKGERTVQYMSTYGRLNQKF